MIVEEKDLSVIPGKKLEKTNINKKKIEEKVINFLFEITLSKINPDNINKILEVINRSAILSPVINTDRNNNVKNIKKHTCM